MKRWTETLLNVLQVNYFKMEEGLKLILEAMTFRVQSEKSYEKKSIDAFVSYSAAKSIAKERMIAAIEKL